MEGTDMIEAKCTRCGETFIPESTDMEDMIHGQTEQGNPCGGIGVVQGAWNVPGIVPSEELNQPLTEQEQHGLEEPNCSKPLCIYHYPQVKMNPDWDQTAEHC
jgi:hypothetical protein